MIRETKQNTDCLTEKALFSYVKYKVLHEFTNHCHLAISPQPPIARAFAHCATQLMACLIKRILPSANFASPDL